MKRYAIVRVDGNCPSHFGVENWKVCRELCYAPKSCDNSLYGDTKEQLIRKVAQVLRQPNGLIVGKDKQHSYRAEYLAKEIIEFLGVEE